jgi:hypothetical protein
MLRGFLLSALALCMAVGYIATSFLQAGISWLVDHAVFVVLAMLGLLAIMVIRARRRMRHEQSR